MRLLERESDPSFAVKVAEALDDPHPLVRSAAKILRKGKTAREQRLTSEACLDITASGDALERALRIADALAKAIEQRGFELCVTALTQERNYGSSYGRNIPHKTGIRVLGSLVEFSIKEDYDRIEVKPKTAGRAKQTHDWLSPPRPQYERVPNGKLILHLDTGYFYEGRRTWKDGKKQRVENCLQQFFVAAIHAAEQQRLKQIEREERERAMIEAQRLKEEERRRAELRAALEFDLGSRLEDARRADQIRAFLKRVESSPLNKDKDFSEDSDLGEWVAWARRYADRLEADAVGEVLILREKPEEKKQW